MDSLCANGDERRVDVGRGQVGVEVREHFAHSLVNVGGHFWGESGKFNFILTFVDEPADCIVGLVRITTL